MKRFLSWLVLVVCMMAFYYGIYYSWVLFFCIFNVIYGFSEVLFWVLVVSYGVASLLAFIILLAQGAKYTVELSQLVCTSRRGARYIAIPIPYMLWIAFLLIGLRVGYVRADIQSAATYITMIIYGVAIMVKGQNTKVMAQ